MPLTTLENVKQWLALADAFTTDDALIDRLIGAASGYIEAWCNRTFASTNYTETRDGSGSSILMFANYPVTAVASVTLYGAAIPASTGPYVPGYVFDPTRLIYRGGCFARDLANVQMSYTAGYASTPAEIEQACIEMIGLRYREKDRIGQVSKSIGGEVVSFSQKDMSDSIKTILMNYRKVIPL